MRYIEQTTPYLCGQACVAMLANVTIEEVIDIMKTDQGTGKKQISDALKHYGIEHASKLAKADNNSALPDVCILKVLLPQYGHWVLYYKGKYYDPEFGLLDERYPKERVMSYLEIYGVK